MLHVLVLEYFSLLLVGGDWNMNLIFPYIGNFIIPIDEIIFFRGVAIPPTRLTCYPQV